MKKIITILLALSLALSLSMTAFAAENNTDPTNIDVVAKVIRDVEGEYTGQNEDGAVSVTTDDGTTVTVIDVPNEYEYLVVVPILPDETAAWAWITSCLNGYGTPAHAYDIYFLNQDGERTNANGVAVSVSCPHCDNDVFVCSLTTGGAVKVLESSATTRTTVITFTTNGSTYYVLTEKTTSTDPDHAHDVNIQEPEGGDVEVSDKTPETGDKVTITPKPDSGKVVDKVTVTDENGNPVKVTDNGDGTYSYTQPDGDVTIKVTFKDKPTTGTTDTPKTGDDTNLELWFGVMIASALALCWIFLIDRRRKEDKSA